MKDETGPIPPQTSIDELGEALDIIHYVRNIDSKTPNNHSYEVVYAAIKELAKGVEQLAFIISTNIDKKILK